MKNTTLFHVTIFVLGCLTMFVFSQNNTGKIVVHKEDTTLHVEKKFDDARRNIYAVGASLGVDGSMNAAAILADFSGYFTIKYLLLRANYSMDLTKSNLISGPNPLIKKGQPYSNFQISGFFNFYDKVKIYKSKALVGVEFAGSTIEFGTRYSRYKNYFIDQPTESRVTFGIGGSIIMSRHNLQFISDSTKKPDFITFANNAPAPQYLIMPYNLFTIGIGINYSLFTYHYYKYKYKDLRPEKFKSKATAIQQIEFLFSPSITHDKMILTQTGNVESMMEVEKVKKFPIGFRILRHGINQKKPGMYYTAELGMRPGIYEKMFPNSIYARLAIGLTI
ncbi:MAG: hypothetical protein N3F09_09865 [Bacteroidia bacterium]|nr:hypothetical protein [Bacteroidia bacterium]